MKWRSLAVSALLSSLVVAGIAAPSDAKSETSEAPATPNRGLVGEWTKLIKTPTIPTHIALLPNGKVLMWVAGSSRAGTNTYIWDPNTYKSVRRNVPKVNLMCPGLVQLANGNVFVAGGQGTAGGNQGLTTTFEFDWVTGTWKKGPTMAARRWYPSLAALPDGEVLILGGGPTVPEVRQADGTLRQLTTAELPLPKRYPFIQVGSSGEVGFYGDNTTLRLLDTDGTGAWTAFGERDSIERVYGSIAMYDIDKVLVAGGGPAGSLPTNSAVVVDVSSGTPVVTPTDPLTYARRQAHLTILADGTVLSTGGQKSKREQVEVSKAVKTPELWNPATGHWTSMALPRQTRQYHSTALLLPDGRVFTGGGGYCSACAKPRYNETSAEIFSPPYLFDANGAPAVRPVIDSAPDTALPGSSYTVHVTSGNGVSKMALIRLGADTHSVDQGQRYVPLTVTPVAGTEYQITLPASRGALPAGYYMLFVINGSGTPSIAKMVLVQ